MAITIKSVNADNSPAPNTSLTFSGFPLNAAALNEVQLTTDQFGVAVYNWPFHILPTLLGAGQVIAVNGLSKGTAPLSLNGWGDGSATVVLAANPSGAISTTLQQVEQKAASTGLRALAIIGVMIGLGIAVVVILKYVGVFDAVKTIKGILSRATKKKGSEYV